MEPTRSTKRPKALIVHILTNSTENVIQNGVIEMEFHDHDLNYCSTKELSEIKFSLPNTNKVNEKLLR